MTVDKLITDHIDIWSSALQTRSTVGRGSNGKIDLYGIKKLRRADSGTCGARQTGAARPE